MDLKSILNSINASYTVKRTVTFDSIGVTIDIQTLTALEEVKVLESCKDLEGSQYIQTLKRNSLAYAIKKINGNDIPNEVPMDDGQKVSKFMFLCSYLDQWSSTVRDVLFEAFTDMNQEMESKVTTSAKFNRFNMSSPSFEEVKPLFKKIDEEEEPMDENEALRKKVEEEIASENAKLSRA